MHPAYDEKNIDLITQMMGLSCGRHILQSQLTSARRLNFPNLSMIPTSLVDIVPMQHNLHSPEKQQQLMFSSSCGAPLA